MTEFQKDVDTWKRKYFDTFRELEEKEESWKEIESLFRIAISRLTLTADTSDPELKQQLEEVRAALRNTQGDHSRLRPLLEKISHTILTQQDKPKPAEKPAPKPADYLAGLFEHLNIPEFQRTKVTVLKAKLAGDDLASATKRVADFINDQVKLASASADHLPQTEESKAEESGLFKRFFGNKEPNEPTSDDAATTDTLPLNYAKQVLHKLLQSKQWPEDTQNKINELVQKTRNIERSYNLQEVLDDVVSLINKKPVTEEEPAPIETAEVVVSQPQSLGHHEVLIQLLHRIDLPASLVQEARVLTQNWEHGISTEQLPDSISSIADLVARSRHNEQKEKKELEVFLSQLTQRLQELDHHIDQTASSEKQASQVRTSMDNQLSDHVRNIETSVSEANDLPSLKINIQQRLDNIQQHMELRRKVEGERQVEVDQEIAQLNEKLHSFEKQTEELQQSLREQRHKALHDALTGLHNRLAYDEKMAEEFIRWRRYKRPITLSVWDIDHFKRINDTYGHKAGDKVLKILADRFNQHIRKSDFMARFGGEEFVLLMPETNLEAAKQVVDKLRTYFGSCQFHHRGTPVSVTISCGLTEFRDGDTGQTVFERADQALYKAKNEGRNRCICG